jgi:hypothetical protein
VSSAIIQLFILGIALLTLVLIFARLVFRIFTSQFWLTNNKKKMRESTSHED